MTKQNIMDIIDKYSNDNIIGFMFDNAGREYIKAGTDISSLFINDELLAFEHEDVSGVKYKSIAAVECIQSVLVINDVNEKSKISMRYAGV